MVFTNPVSINTKNFAQSQSHPVLTCLNPFLRAPTSKAYKQPRVQRRGPRLCAGGPLPHTALLDERVIRRPAAGAGGGEGGELSGDSPLLRPPVSTPSVSVFGE